MFKGEENKEINNNHDIFDNIAWLYSEGQLSLDVAIHSSKLSKEEFLNKYAIYKQKSNM